MTSDVRICADVDEISRRVAEAAATIVNEGIRRHGRCSLALSGGRTSRTLYSLLASEFRSQILWDHVHVFWGDERYLPADDAESNYRMAKNALLDHVPCPAANIHPMPMHFASANDAAQEHERILRGYFGADWPRFEFVHLRFIVPTSHHEHLLCCVSGRLSPSQRHVPP